MASIGEREWGNKLKRIGDAMRRSLAEAMGEEDVT